MTDGDHTPNKGTRAGGLRTYDGAKNVLLSVRDLTVQYRSSSQEWQPVVRDVAFDIHRGETLGLVGESGSGKTVTANAIMGLASARGGRISSGSVTFDGINLTRLNEREARQHRGKSMGLIFQNATRSLNPAFTVGDQIAESVRVHQGSSRRVAWERAVQLLERVHIPNPRRRAREYPHSFSGGMCQRVMIAMSLACEPSLVIADEPTTALDVTVQMSILDLLREIQQDTGIAILFVSHDLGVIAEMCDSVAVMYSGEIVESGPVEAVLVNPRHPYTEGLLSSIPKVGDSRLISIPGGVPGPGSWPTGCHFHPRCTYAEPGRCDAPGVVQLQGTDHLARCVRTSELTLIGVRT